MMETTQIPGAQAEIASLQKAAAESAERLAVLEREGNILRADVVAEIGRRRLMAELVQRRVASLRSAISRIQSA
jgi:hypothetical protein